MALLTGSRVYGTPTEDSDVDLVVLLPESAVAVLRGLADPWGHPDRDEYIAAGGEPLRFGKLILICCLNPEYYKVWKEGTRRLKRSAPVSRAFAVSYFRELRRQAGFVV